ncbi:polysaccharide export protein [Hyphomicrobium denitrificans 1NES1]|uniref:Polysaccharide export protein n=1 Tax=Hyphomicrobium denitrificans 1NES1 TaxID=670307 RepID=N0B5U4_9HYPH|nr:polysaccharide biosynthesis/export family protein [Hyphomicrobium denitrificans]AGK57597.1 polysaccharide export protein [Hyphomicrobium denitrificans 1NES1]
MDTTRHNKIGFTRLAQPKVAGLMRTLGVLMVLGLPIASGYFEPAAADMLNAAPVTEVAHQPSLLGESQESKAVADVDQTYDLDIGDRVKVSIYGREDLSAIYSVNEMGQVRIPTLGGFEAAGHSPLSLEEQIGTAVEKVMQRKTDVTVEVSDRRPIFVSGLVAKPGSYPFMRDMTVIQALALAGGVINSASAQLPTEALRETAKLRMSDVEYKRLVARQARLLADLENKSEIDVPKVLIDLAGPVEATRLIADEQRYYNSQRDSLQTQMSSLQDSIQQAKLETESYINEQSALHDQLTARQNMLASIKNLATKGLTTQQRLTDSEILVALVQRDQRQTSANIARSRQNLGRLERELAVLTLERRQTIEKDLQGIDDQLANLETNINQSVKIIHQVGGLPKDLVSKDGTLQYNYKILRKNDVGGLTPLTATDSSTLLPGDVVQVTIEKTNIDNFGIDKDPQVTTISDRLTSIFKQ